ncbi:putative 60S ribosomal protein L9 [Paratrimastix pyriformis]|uniref:60S ribosomal protein L9 n=1 Tax=Paratrimastix pyriformis TaxID=342808 RepID=A0ABQ8UD58_9EUKA|nr:putative 60S ribosomal protein L9 [Paratrimastix pyriformis]
MKLLHAHDSVAIPEGVKVELKNRRVRVTGPRGTLSRDFRHCNLDMAVVGNKVQVELWEGSRKTIARVRTLCSEVENLITGVTKGYKYKMRSVYAHFPIVCAISDDKKTVEVRNFLGEKRARVVQLRDGVIANRSENVKDEITIEGNDIDAVGLSAAQVQQISRVRNKDIRKFLDGVYVSEKTTITSD